jgi:hypothetical protein
MIFQLELLEFVKINVCFTFVSWKLRSCTHNHKMKFKATSLTNWDEWWAIAQSWRKFWFKDFMWSTTMPCALARWWCQWWEPSEQLLDALEKVREFQPNLKVIPHGTFCQKLDMTSQMTSCNIQDRKHILKNYNNRKNKIYWP